MTDKRKRELERREEARRMRYLIVSFILLLVGVPMVLIISCSTGKKRPEIKDTQASEAETGSIRETEKEEGAVPDTTEAENIPSGESLSPTEEIDPELKRDVLTHYRNLGVVTAESFLNIRVEPSRDALIIGKIWKNSGLNILEDLGNGWLHITSGKVEGYVASEYIATGEAAEKIALEESFLMAKVSAECLNVRDAASMEGEVWTQLNVNEMQTVHRTLDGWAEITINNTVGYISMDFVELGYYLNEAVPWSSLDDTTELRRNLVNYGMQFLGTPYKYGGMDLYQAIDCSGFTQLVFREFGVSLHRESYNQKTQGNAVPDIGSAQPGDLLFYTDSAGNVNHVAIYIGSGQILHACESRGGVVITSYNYSTSPTYIKDVIQDN